MFPSIFCFAFVASVAVANPVSIRTVEIHDQTSLDAAKAEIKKQSDPVIAILDIHKTGEESAPVADLFTTIDQQLNSVIVTTAEISDKAEIHVSESQMLRELEFRALSRISRIRFTLTMIRVGGLFGGIFYVTQSVTGPGMAALIGAVAASMSCRLMLENHITMKWLKTLSFPVIDQLISGMANLQRRASRPAAADWLENIPKRSVAVPFSFLTAAPKVFALNFGYIFLLHTVASLLGTEAFYVQNGMIDTAKFWSMLTIAGLATKAELAGFIANSSIYSDLAHAGARQVTKTDEMEKGIMRVATAMTISLTISAVQSIVSTVAQVSGQEGRWVLDSIFYAGSATILAHLGLKWWWKKNKSCESQLVP